MAVFAKCCVTNIGLMLQRFTDWFARGCFPEVGHLIQTRRKHDVAFGAEDANDSPGITPLGWRGCLGRGGLPYPYACRVDGQEKWVSPRKTPVCRLPP